MGLKLRLNLFHDVSAAAVRRELATFYRGLGRSLIREGEDYWAFHLHDREGAWTTLWLDGGWEWDVRRQAQLAVSRALRCAGFLVFVYDGDYWGYEFFDGGEVLDQFVQEEPEGAGGWFPGRSLVGQATVLARRLGLSPDDVAPYLVQNPMRCATAHALPADDDELIALGGMAERLDVPARTGDEFTRFSECAVLDFLRMLGVGVVLRSSRVTFTAPELERFWVEGQNTHHNHQKAYPRRT